METETIDKLFLELSQFTQAKTQKEIQLEAVQDILREALEELSCLGNGDRPGNSDGNVIAQNALARAKEVGS